MRVRLVKVICKRCLDRHDMDGWREVDERRWRAGAAWPRRRSRVMCPSEFGGTVYVLVDGIPSGCPYAAEHLVSQDAE